MAKDKNIKVALHVWGSGISLMANLHLALAMDVDWLEIPNVKLDLFLDKFQYIKFMLLNNNIDISDGLGIKINNTIKNNYVFIPGSGYNFKGKK